MNATNAKNESASRTQIIYDEPYLMNLHEKYGDETEIKKHVDTSAVLYEIRTALRYWKGGKATHRTSDCVWTRLEMFEHNDVTPEEVEAV